MKCPRCNSESIDIMAKSPVGDVWEVYLCDTCTFSWRSTEGTNITDPEQYDKRFKLNPEEFDTLAQIPPIPPLLKK
ncbi:non-oxidative hydroxyarylic acid decarboxylases subunit D [Tissierella sp.]|uniref:non-oxidative hydroxyarylic acid decarboxylases subunit D n=1 Tax=Tissierella sp. TaxID=41274 RepID=UPI00285DD6A6|nr:non-oxidative hydroxyarylic acid decarboxylases subunit D [Tissierella sp.]MDR7855504.1 non-oxidative hydroxyarylic acid decarboxylases subunit D [Tissierella sp.]